MYKNSLKVIATSDQSKLQTKCVIEGRTLFWFISWTSRNACHDTFIRYAINHFFVYIRSPWIREWLRYTSLSDSCLLIEPGSRFKNSVNTHREMLQRALRDNIKIQTNDLRSRRKLGGKPFGDILYILLAPSTFGAVIISYRFVNVVSFVLLWYLHLHATQFVSLKS